MLFKGINKVGNGRIIMKDGSRDVLQRKIDRLRQYANQCRITGDLEEYREALKEIANLEEEFKNLMKNLLIKDAAAVALDQIRKLKRSMAKGTALKSLDSLKKDMKKTKDAGKVEVKRQSDVGSNRWGIYVNGKLVEGGFFSKEVAEEAASKNYGGAKDSKDAAAVALKGLDEVKKQMKDAAIIPQAVMNMRSRNAELKKELEKARKEGDKASETFFLEAIKENEDAEKRYMSNRDSQIKDADLPVGKHNADPDDKFNAEELAMGIKIEMEHTENEDIAKAIAKDHLNELKDYYTRLKKMEEEAIEAEKVTKDEGNFLVGKRIIVNAGRFTNAPATVIEIGGQVTHGVNGVYAKMDTGEKVWIARPDFEFKDSKTKDASQAYIDGYTAARGAYHKGTNPIKNDPAKAAEWDRGWEDGKADKDELSAKGSGQEYIKYGSHFKDKKMKDGNGEQALDKCRHSLFPVANELATIASSSIYEDRIRKAAKRAERLVDEARHVLFDAV